MNASDARLALVPATACILVLGAGMALVMHRYPPPSLAWVLLGGAALIGVLLLALERYDAAAALGFVLIGVVQVEPAPPDLVFVIVIAVAAITGSLDLMRIPSIVLVPLGVLAAISLLSAVEAVEAGTAATFLSITLYLTVFSLWVATFVDSRRRAGLVANAYLAIAVASAAAGVAALFVPFPGHDLLVQHGGTRVSALFQDPNVFGPFLIPIALILAEDSLSPRLFALSVPARVTALVLLALGILFSYSRASWVALIVGVVVLVVILLMRRERAGRIVAVLAVGAVAVAVAASVVVITGSSDFLEQRAGEQSYDARRFDAQRAGLGLAESHPIGIGPGQFELVVQYAAHSTYVRVFAEQGPLGLASLLAFSLGTLLLALNNVAKGRSTFGIGSAALAAAWLGLLVNSLFVDTLHWRHLWLVAGLIWAGSIRGQAPTPALPR